MNDYQNIRPTLEEDKQIHYVSNPEIINFIDQHTDDSFKWNEIHDYALEESLIADSYEPVYWSRDMIEDSNKRKYYSEDQVLWLQKFFIAHPWIDRMFVVFD